MARSKYASALYHLKLVTSDMEGKLMKLQLAHYNTPKDDVETRQNIHNIGVRMNQLDIDIRAVMKPMEEDVAKYPPEPKAEPSERAGRKQAAS